MIVEALLRTSRDLFLDLFSLSFSCAGALKFALFALGAKRAPNDFSSFSKLAWPPGSPRGRHERIKKRTKTAHKNTNKNNKKLDF